MMQKIDGWKSIIGFAAIIIMSGVEMAGLYVFPSHVYGMVGGLTGIAMRQGMKKRPK